MKGFVLRFIPLLILCSVLVSLPEITVAEAEPRTIVVPDDYPTINSAIGNASEGDTIYVKKGTYYENITIDKSLSLKGEDKKTTIIDGGYNRTVVTITRNGVNVTGFTIRNGKQAGVPYFVPPPEPKMGIHLRSANYCDISGNTITNNDYSIVLYGSSDNSIVGNKITNSRKGIELESSSNNRLVENNITNNYYYGIGLHYSSNNSIAGNNITANRNEGVQIEESCQFNSIVGNTITNNNDGVMLWCWDKDYSTNFNSIFGNTISSNTVAGILLDYVKNTITVGNNITNNGVGIWFYDRYDNAKFYHNNFINNTIQVDTFPYYSSVWDGGYRSGGNYWDDYTGVDNDGDDIGDTPYVIDKNNQDNYPLMNPVVNPEFPDTTLPTSEPFPTWIIATIALVAVVGAGFLVYFRKIWKTTEKAKKISEGVK